MIAALASSATAVSERRGIPRKTIAYWLDSPEFADLRQKTREDMAEESRVLAHQVLANIQQRLPEFEPRDLSILLGILVDKAQLLAGAATSRLEVNDVATLDDHETQTLRDWLDSLKAEVPSDIPSGGYLVPPDLIGEDGRLRES